MPLYSLLFFKTPYSGLLFLAISSLTKALLLSIIFVIFSICLFFTSSLKIFLFYTSSGRRLCFLAVWEMLNFLLGDDWIKAISAFLGVGILLLIFSIDWHFSALLALSVLMWL